MVLPVTGQRTKHSVELLEHSCRHPDAIMPGCESRRADRLATTLYKIHRKSQGAPQSSSSGKVLLSMQWIPLIYEGDPAPPPRPTPRGQP